MSASSDSFAERTGDPTIDRLSALPTAAISDALDSMGLPGSLAGIRALTPGVRATGPAFPVAYAPITEKTGTVGDFLDDVPAGAVVVIDNAGRTDCTVWGGIMTQTAAARRIAGTVVHGACRDVATTLSERYPMWSSGVFMRTGKDRVRMVSAGQPVVVDGVTVAAGDVVCGDADGVVVVPAARTTEVAELAERIERVEAEIVDAVRGGRTLRQARSELGYHRLQSRS
jgi:4-hydroxy-4-methyl-2-oxoglutarate aldolase